METIRLNWSNAHTHGDLWISHHRFRHKLFVERLSWDLPQFEDLEFDQFDTPAAEYLVVVDGMRTVQGCVRLSPTTMPYMAKTLWPEMLGDTPPVDRKVWEATRFGVDSRLDAVERKIVALRLIFAAQTLGLDRGLSHLLGVMPMSIFRVCLQKEGCCLNFLGKPQRISGHLVGAALIEISRSVAAHLKSEIEKYSSATLRQVRTA